MTGERERERERERGGGGWLHLISKSNRVLFNSTLYDFSQVFLCDIVNFVENSFVYSLSI